MIAQTLHSGAVSEAISTDVPGIAFSGAGGSTTQVDAVEDVYAQVAAKLVYAITSAGPYIYPRNQIGELSLE